MALELRPPADAGSLRASPDCRAGLPRHAGIASRPVLAPIIADAHGATNANRAPPDGTYRYLQATGRTVPRLPSTSTSCVARCLPIACCRARHPVQTGRIRPVWPCHKAKSSQPCPRDRIRPNRRPPTRSPAGKAAGRMDRRCRGCMPEERLSMRPARQVSRRSPTGAACRPCLDSSPVRQVDRVNAPARARRCASGAKKFHAARGAGRLYSQVGADVSGIAHIERI